MSLIALEDRPALLLKRGSERLLVVGDIHLGWELKLAERGIHVPSQTPRVLRKLREAVEISKANRIVFLGDVKHTITGAQTEEEWREIPGFFEEACKLVEEVHVILGNHDGDLEPLVPRQVRIHPPTGMALWNKFGLLHGHAWPAPELLGCRTLIMGHLHPSVMFLDALGFKVFKPVWVKALCDGGLLTRNVLRSLRVKFEGPPEAMLKKKYGISLRVQSCVFVPAFSDFLGGRAINVMPLEGSTGHEEPPGPFLRSGVINFDKAEVQLVDGTYLGRVEQLRSLALEGGG